MNEQQSSNINADELDEETKKKLKGDTIGDTFYSQSFVIKTLLQLQDLQWCEEVEHDLCFLWDMTVEKDVCKYLLDLNYPSIASTAIAKYEKEERFVEIMIGILANILVSDCEKNMNDIEIQHVINQLINTIDAALLIQIMRFFDALIYTMPEKVSLVGEEVIDRMLFILKHSENSDLITHTMQVFLRLTEDFKLDKVYVNDKLYGAVIEGFDTIFSVEVNNFEVEIDIEETNKIVKIFLRLITNMCAYADKYHHDEGFPNCINNCPKLAITICRILRHFTSEEYLFSLSKDFNEYISAFQTIFTTRDVTVITDINNGLFNNIFHSLCNILYLLYQCKSEFLENFNLVLDLIGYLIYCVDQNIVLTELKKFRYRRSIVILNSLKESSRTFEFDISEKLRFLFSKFK